MWSRVAVWPHVRLGVKIGVPIKFLRKVALISIIDFSIVDLNLCSKNMLGLKQ